MAVEELQRVSVPWASLPTEEPSARMSYLAQQAWGHAPHPPPRWENRSTGMDRKRWTAAAASLEPRTGQSGPEPEVRPCNVGHCWTWVLTLPCGRWTVQAPATGLLRPRGTSSCCVCPPSLPAGTGPGQPSGLQLSLWGQDVAVKRQGSGAETPH